DVAGADVVIISKDSCQLSVDLNSFGPVFLGPGALLILLRREIWIRAGWRRRAFAEVIGNLAAITERVQCGYHRSTVRSFPDADVEGNPNRRFFRRVGAAYVRRGLPAG